MGSLNKHTIEMRLESFCILKDSGLCGHYVDSNIEYYARKYKEVTGDWYHYSPSLQKMITEDGE